MEILDDDDIPAFLKADRDVNKIVDDLEGDDDFDFPSLDDEDDGGEVVDIFPGEAFDPPAEAPKPEPAPKPKKETKADKQAKLKQQPAEQTELKTALDQLAKAGEELVNKRARPGNNSGVEAGPLRAFIERIERLEEDKKSVSDDIKDVKAEAKGVGYDVKTINAILKKRKQDKAKRDEEQALLDLYMFALGM
jgi:uncharacterized protein (UPF0335 family)